MTAAGMRIGEWLTSAARMLAEAGIEDARREARLILRSSTDCVVPSPDDVLSTAMRERLESMCRRRARREPLSRIRGYRELWGRELELSDATLDPRPETETLIAHVLRWAEARDAAHSPLRVLDLGTGTGAILVTLLAELPLATGMGTDLSSAALETAERNARRHGVADRAELLRSDWLDAVEGTFDVIVSNPPYIRSRDIPELEPEVALYDPRLALDGGEDGLDAYRGIIGPARRHLRCPGLLALEVGASQAAEVARLMEESGLRPPRGRIDMEADLAGRARVVAYSAHCAPQDEITVGITQASR